MLTNRSAPPATVTPVLVYPDVRRAVAWLSSAFGFEERVRIGEAHRAQRPLVNATLRTGRTDSVERNGTFARH
jgi:uncharacterized glyoxalase superfamily protein PhnB